MSTQVVTTCLGVNVAPEASEATVLLQTNAGVFPIDELIAGASLPKPGEQVVIKFIPPGSYPAHIVLGAARVDEQAGGKPIRVTVFSGSLELAA